MRWKDVSSYSRGERGTKEPTAWELDGCAMRIRVHRLHGCAGWFFSVRELGIDGLDLMSNVVEEARDQAIERVRQSLENYQKSLTQALLLPGDDQVKP